MSTILHYNARAYPSPTGNGLAILLAVVVRRVEGIIVYAAIVPDNSVVDPDYSQVKDWVARNGNKLSFQEAQSHFPIGLDARTYIR